MNENEKVIHEVRVVETEDGFRIELKGDKEQLRQLISRFGLGNQHRGFGGHQGFAGHHGFGDQRGFGGHHPFGGHHNPFDREKAKKHGRKRHFYDLGPWWDDSAASEEA